MNETLDVVVTAGLLAVDLIGVAIDMIALIAGITILGILQAVGGA
ncbi:MAG TPA: hypothetical protein VFT94_00585 [Gaiellaceae bacterium]|nr:hypothetical protein [Gaiellaceae bacterium]